MPVAIVPYKCPWLVLSENFKGVGAELDDRGMWMDISWSGYWTRWSSIDDPIRRRHVNATGTSGFNLTWSRRSIQSCLRVHGARTYFKPGWQSLCTSSNHFSPCPIATFVFKPWDYSRLPWSLKTLNVLPLMHSSATKSSARHRDIWRF
jgi:hypothetical protein